MNLIDDIIDGILESPIGGIITIVVSLFVIGVFLKVMSILSTIASIINH